ncbi:MAG: InlB B-repeat-containing protein, partial [Clostridia bacterium]|nr:InlB B-repeat-containing protein [Clostridia bacterium]
MKKTKLLTMLLSVATLFGTAAALSSCGISDKGTQDKATATISFDINLDGYETNSVKDKTVSLGKRVPTVKAYITGDNPDNLQLYGWYTDEACTEKWDFKNDRVQGDMTLYAKWVEQYTIDYYVNGELLKSEFAFKGDTLEEDASLVAGFKYLGTYLDADYQTPYDYSAPLTEEIDLHINRSRGIYMSDHTEEGELSSSSLTDYLVAYVGSTSWDEKGNVIEQEGWVEPYTVSTNYAEGTVTENCTYVNFGYQPTYGDGYVELCLAIDITQSQIIRFWFKNLGKASSLNLYFTALLDAENNVYSETGSIYTQDFCYPNYTGSGVEGGIALDDSQIQMSESDEWTYVDFNLYEVYKNGYSIWGTSPYLGALRIQANYTCVDEEDWSNVFLIKSIEGIPYDVPVEDSEEIKSVLTDAEALTEDQIKEVSDAQAENPQGFTFPKDGDCVTGVIGGA